MAIIPLDERVQRLASKGDPIAQAITSVYRFLGSQQLDEANIAFKSIDTKNIKDNAVDKTKIAHTFGASNKAPLNYVPLSSDDVVMNNNSEVDWTDLDLTSSTSSTATVVHLYLQIKDNTKFSWLGVRTNGGGHTRYLQVGETDVYHRQEFIIPMDSNQIIEYAIDDAGGSAVTSASIIVCGYFEPMYK